MKRTWLYTCPFIGIELCLYILFLWISHGETTSILMYTSILIAFLWVTLVPIQGSNRRLVQMALFCTAVADFFLVIQSRNQIPAMIWFNLVQIIYAVRLFYHQKAVIPRLSVRLFLVFIALGSGMVVAKNTFDILLALTLFYFANLVMNMIDAWITDAKNWAFGLGLILFIGCDLMVGLGNASSYVVIPPESFLAWLLQVPINLAWVFYLPSQVLIALSIIRKKPLS
ncbi:MAG: lysoplasmalogenase family protein [Bacilli bacterium]|nr:lysoplasmalogenase family protein [Bacilli bacterium]